MSTSRFGNRPKVTFTGTGTGRPPQQIAGYIKSYNIGKEENQKTDYVELAITHPIQDKDGNLVFPEYDENGYPTTVIKMFQATPAEKRSRPVNEQPRTIFGLSRKRGSGPAIDVGGVAYFHGVYPQSDGSYRAQASHGIASTANLQEGKDVQGDVTPPEKFFLDMSLVQIRPVPKAARERFKADGTAARQTVLLFEPNNAMEIEPDANGDFSASLKNLIEQNRVYAESCGVSGAFAVIARSHEPTGESWRDRVGHSIKIGMVKQEGSNEYVLVSADNAFDYFIETAKKSPVSDTLPDIISGALKGYSLTYLPGLAPAQGAGLSPCSTDDKGRSPYDRGDACRIFDTDPDTGKTGIVDRGVFYGIVSLSTVKTTRMINHHEATIRGCAWPIADAITPDMPDWHREAAIASGLANMAEAKKYYEQNRSSAPNQASEADGETHETEGRAPSPGPDAEEVPF